MARVRLDGIVRFPWRIPVSSDALGMTVNAKVANIGVRLILPIIDDPERLTLRTPSEENGQPPRENFNASWGHGFPGRTCMVGAARAKCLANLPVPDNPGGGDLISLGKGFISWFEILRDWAAAWSRQPVTPPGRVDESAFEFVTAKGLRVASGGSVHVYAFGGIHPLTPAQVESACKKASQGHHLPLEHRLLLSARTASLERDYRKAVIDAATATEVALASAIGAGLSARKVPSDYIDQATETANGLGGLMSLYASLGNTPAISRAKALDQLARVRNRAAHAGYIPSEDETTKALQHARALVEGARPLPVI